MGAKAVRPSGMVTVVAQHPNGRRKVVFYYPRYKGCGSPSNLLSVPRAVVVDVI